MIRKAYYSIETGRASVRAGYSRENDAQIVELNVRGYGIDLLPSDALKIASALTLAAEAAIRTDDDDAASERVTHPEPLSSRSSKPKLVLPLVIGKRYRVINEGFDEGVSECVDYRSDEDWADCRINGWFCRRASGAVVAVEDLVKLEGPIEG